MHIRSKRIAKFGVSILAIAPWLVAAPAAEAACEIKDSPCYPWRIEAGANDTVLLEVIPNNAITSSTYRVCLCQPTKSVSLVLDFKEREVNLGSVPSASKGAVCRDFRIQTARSSRLLIKRPEGVTGDVEGCYATF
jgi:hypothetical protein